MAKTTRQVDFQACHRCASGTWEGDGGLDIAYSHAQDAVIETRYRERTTFNPFGPVENEVTVTLDGGTYAYEECTTIEHARISDVLLHTDRNVLRRVE